MTGKSENVSKVDKPPKAAKPRAAALLNVWQRINAVRGEIKIVAKDKRVDSGGGYMVATHEVIKEMLRPLMAKHGLVDYVLEIEYERIETGVTRGQSRRKLVSHQGKYQYVVVNIDDPKDTHSFTVRGDGEDAGDKGPSKATTYAMKAGQKILFQISADEHDEDVIPEQELESQAAATLNPKQIDDVLWLAKKLFRDEADKTVSRMCHKLFNVDEVSDIPAEHYDHAVNALNNQADRDTANAEEKPTDERPHDPERDSQPPTDELPPPTDEPPPPEPL